METIKELLDYCYKHEKSYIMVDELKALTEGCPMVSNGNGNTDFPPKEDLTDKAICLLTEVMISHERTFSKLEKQLIETGVMSGKCYVSWHENRYNPGATVDNLRTMGFEKFYETYKGNWEKIKDFRRKLINEKKEF